MLSGLELTSGSRTKNFQQSTYLVNTIRLDELLKEYNAPSFIDYLSIDVEGAELEVLKSIDFTNYSFGYISIEHNNNTGRKEEFHKIFTNNGYIFKQFNQFDVDYIHKSLVINHK